MGRQAHRLTISCYDRFDWSSIIIRFFNFNHKLPGDCSLQCYMLTVLSMLMLTVLNPIRATGRFWFWYEQTYSLFIRPLNIRCCWGGKCRELCRELPRILPALHQCPKQLESASITIHLYTWHMTQDALRLSSSVVWTWHWSHFPAHYWLPRKRHGPLPGGDQPETGLHDLQSREADQAAAPVPDGARKTQGFRFGYSVELQRWAFRVDRCPTTAPALPRLVGVGLVLIVSCASFYRHTSSSVTCVFYQILCCLQSLPLFAVFHVIFFFTLQNLSRSLFHFFLFLKSRF